MTRYGRWMLVLLLLAALPLFAQDESTPSEATSAADTFPAVLDTPEPAAPQPASAPAPTEPLSAPDSDGMMMNFDNAPLPAVLKAMSEALGLTIVNPPAISGRVTIMSRTPLTTAEAIAALNAALKTHGLTTIRGGNILRVIALEEAKTSSIPVRSGANPMIIQQSDDMITQVIPVRYADAEKLKQDLADLLPGYAHLTSNAASNTLVYTATETDVRHLVEIIASLDKNKATVDQVRVFALKYAEADDVAKLVEEIFSTETTGTNRNDNRTRRQWGPPGLRNQNQTNDTGDAKQAKITAAADKETNSVVVSAPAEIMELIADVITKLDVDPTIEEMVFTYPLAYATAADLADVLTEILKEETTSAQSNQRNGRSRFFGPPDMNADASTTTSSSSDLAGNVTIKADKNTNSLLVRTAPKYVERVKALIAELDRPVRQVLIKVLIAEVTLDDSLDLGAEFSVLNIKIGNGVAEIGTDFGLASATTGLVTTYTNVDFEATLRALETVGKLEILSRPYLLGSENKEASITVGEEVPYITNSRVTDTGQTVNTVDYRDIGIILTLTPYVGPNGMVMLDVEQEISSRTGKTVTVSEDFTAEVYNKRTVNTRVVVGNGRTVVIGGLMQDSLTDTVNKVPLLGDLPIIGPAFRRTQTTKAKTELLLFLSPQTALTPEELAKVSKDVETHAAALPDAIEPGHFDKTLKQIGGRPVDVIPLDSLELIAPVKTAEQTNPASPTQTEETR